MQTINIDLQPSEEAAPTRNTAFQRNASHSAKSSHTNYQRGMGKSPRTDSNPEMDRHGSHPEVYLLKKHGLTSGSSPPKMLCAMQFPRSLRLITWSLRNMACGAVVSVTRTYRSSTTFLVSYFKIVLSLSFSALHPAKYGPC
jgi:hypothetical protein